MLSRNFICLQNLLKNARSEEKENPQIIDSLHEKILVKTLSAFFEFFNFKISTINV